MKRKIVAGWMGLLLFFITASVLAVEPWSPGYERAEKKEKPGKEMLSKEKKTEQKPGLASRINPTPLQFFSEEKEHLFGNQY